MAKTKNDIKQQIIRALEHPESQDGLFFRNFANLHEEDERPAVIGDEADILEALQALISEGKVILTETLGEAVFMLPNSKPLDLR